MKQSKAERQPLLDRRAFLAAAAAGATATSVLSAAPAGRKSTLQVWACGGLAEAFIPTNREYKRQTGVEIAFTGAFAASGKSLLGSAS